MRERERSDSPCPNRFPLSGWVYAFPVVHLRPSLAPAAKAVCLLTFYVWGEVLFENLAAPSASVSPHCSLGLYL